VLVIVCFRSWLRPLISPASVVRRRERLRRADENQGHDHPSVLLSIQQCLAIHLVQSPGDNRTLRLLAFVIQHVVISWSCCSCVLPYAFNLLFLCQSLHMPFADLQNKEQIVKQGKFYRACMLYIFVILHVYDSLSVLSAGGTAQKAHRCHSRQWKP
jgi:hypothetical protein